MEIITPQAKPYVKQEYYTAKRREPQLERSLKKTAQRFKLLLTLLSVYSIVASGWRAAGQPDEIA
jgi:hypothetical protein